MAEQPSARKPGMLREKTAEEIRALLGRRRMSGSELARRTGMKQPYLSRRMTGELAFDLDDLEIIARELNVTVTELLGGDSQHTVADLPLTEGLVPTPPKPPLTVARLIPTMRRPARIESGMIQPPRPFSSSAHVV